MNGQQEDIDIVKRYKDLAREWLAQQPRDKLGVFAIDFELVNAFAASTFLFAENNQVPIKTFKEMSGAVISDWNQAVENGAVNTRGGSFTMMAYALGEVHFWRKQNGLEYSKDVISVQAEWKAIQKVAKEHSKILDILFQNPTYMPYFAVGVTDIKVIKRCIANNIDAQLAMNLKLV